MKIKRGTARRLGLRQPGLPFHLSLRVEDEPYRQAAEEFFQEWVKAAGPSWAHPATCLHDWCGQAHCASCPASSW